MTLQSKKGSLIADWILVVVIGLVLIFTIIVSSQFNSGLNTAIANSNIDAQIKSDVNAMATRNSSLNDQTFLIIFLGLHLVLFVSAWLVPSHPIFMIFFIFALIPVLVVQAIVLAWSWENISHAVSGLSSNHPMTDFIMDNIIVIQVVMFFTYLAILYTKSRQQ